MSEQEGRENSTDEQAAYVQVEGEATDTPSITTTEASTDAPFTFAPMTKEVFDAKLAALPKEPEAPPQQLKKVAILGFTDSYKLAPFADPEWEIWGLNELYQFIPRWTRWFEIHDRTVWEEDRSRAALKLKPLAAMTCPVYMQKHYDDIPASVPYPLDDVLKAFPNPCPGALPYLTNSISYMLALAILEGHFGEISIYGVDMAADCLAPDMRVLTADLKWVAVGDLKVGQELLAFDEHCPVGLKDIERTQFRKYRKTSVVSMSEIVRPCHRLHMEDGTTLVASVGHKWLTLGGIQAQRRWLETSKLQGRDIYPKRTSTIVKVLQPWGEIRSWDSGYVAAAFDGEGHISQGPRTNCVSSHMSIGFAQCPNEMLAEVNAALGRLGYQLRNATEMEGGCLSNSIKGPRAELLRFLGQMRPPRLLAKFDPDQVGAFNSIGDVKILSNEFIGEQSVIGLTTTTGTVIVEGFASHNSEYSIQRPSCEYFIGVAQARGIKVYIPPEADLCKTLFLYGYQESQAAAFDRKLKARLADLTHKQQDADNRIAMILEERAQYRGALQDTQHILTNWKSQHTSS